jgi:hypothetical protein
MCISAAVGQKPSVENNGQISKRIENHVILKAAKTIKARSLSPFVIGGQEEFQNTTLLKKSKLRSTEKMLHWLTLLALFGNSLALGLYDDIDGMCSTTVFRGCSYDPAYLIFNEALNVLRY